MDSIWERTTRSHSRREADNDILAPVALSASVKPDQNLGKGVKVGKERYTKE